MAYLVRTYSCGECGCDETYTVVHESDPKTDCGCYAYGAGRYYQEPSGRVQLRRDACGNYYVSERGGRRRRSESSGAKECSEG